MIAMGRLLSFVRSYRRQVALAILLGCATIASNMGLLATAAYLIAAAALKPLLVALAVPIYVVRLCGVARGFSRYAERLVSHKMTLTLLAQVRTWFFSSLEPLAPARLLRYRSGDLLTRIVADIEELENIYLRAFSPAAVALLMSIITVALFAFFSPALALAAAGFLALAGIVVPLLVGLLTRGLGRRQLEARAELGAHIVDGIQGLQDLLAFRGAAERQQQRVATLNEALGTVQRRRALIAGLGGALHDLAANAATWVVLLLAIPLVTQQRIGAVYLAFLALVMLSSFEAVQPLGQAFQTLGRTIAAGERLYEIIDARPEVADPALPLPMPLPSHAASALAFERVSFSYNADGMVLEEISFSAAPGSRVAIVGPSGAGKSTLAHLALRFWDVSSGAIYLGGHDIRGYALDELRNAIAVVEQDTHVFGDTVRNYLLLARPGASDAELACALEHAQLRDVVKRLPHGLDTWVGEHGLRLSGGERQRLAIARALLRDAPIIMLDEATANLDPVTEHELLSALYTLMRGRTVLVLGHRLIAMEIMDEILVLDHGRIVERGTHARLSGAHGLYRQMLDAQNQMLVLTQRLQQEVSHG